jgi:hypothetical protein
MAALKDRHAFRLRVDPGEEDLGVTFVLRLRHLEKGASLGRIIPSDAGKESCFAVSGNPKMKLQGSRSSGREILQSQSCLFAKNRFTINTITVVHGRQITEHPMTAAARAEID